MSEAQKHVEDCAKRSQAEKRVIFPQVHIIQKQMTEDMSLDINRMLMSMGRGYER